MRYVLLFFGLLAGLSLLSQNVEKSYQHHDILIGYGAFPIDQFLSVESNMLNSSLPDKRYVRDHYSGSGVITLTYRRISRSGFFMWGVTAGYNQSSASVYHVGQLVGELDRNFITVAVELEYRYVNSGIVQVYSGAGLGYQFGNEKLKPTVESGLSEVSGSINRLAYQANVIGVRIGKTFGGFAELGFGYKGIVNVGLSVQLY